MTFDIPLCDSSPTRMTLHLLYDCYIQLSTLEIPLDNTLHYNAHVPMWDKMAWASHARHHWHSVHCDETNSLTCLWWWRWWADAKLGRLWWLHALHGEILLKRTLASIASGCIDMAPPSNSSAYVCMVFLGMTELATHWCIVSTLIFQCVLVVMCINCQLQVLL